MAWRDGLAKECHRALALMQDCTEPSFRSVTLHHKFVVEGQQLEDRRHGEHPL
jgi:hypothetical protein